MTDDPIFDAIIDCLGNVLGPREQRLHAVLSRHVNQIREQRDRARENEGVLYDLVKAIDEVSADLGDKYPALSLAYMRAKEAIWT